MRALLGIACLPTCLFGVISLDTCFNAALMNHESFTLQTLALEDQCDTHREILSYTLPQITTHADIMAGGKASTFDHQQKVLNATASVKVPLFQFFRASYALDAQKKQIQAQTFENHRKTQEIFLLISQLYFRILETSQIEHILKDSIQTLQAQEQHTHDLFQEGLVHQNDLLLIQIQRKQRAQNLLEIEHQLLIQLAKLSRFTGLHLEHAHELYPYLDHNHPLIDLEKCLETALDTHPQVRALSKQIDAASHALASQKASAYPLLYAFSNYSTNNDYSLPYRNGINVGLGVDFPLYDGGLNRVKVSQKRREWHRLKMQKEALIKDLRLLIKEQSLNAIKAYEKLPLSQEMITLNQKNYTTSQDLYQQGLLSMHDILNNERKLLESKAQHLQQLYHFYMAHAELTFALGEDYAIKSPQDPAPYLDHDLPPHVTKLANGGTNHS